MNNKIPEKIWERIRNLPYSGECLIVSCIFEKDFAKLNNQKRIVINRLNFYIKYIVGGTYDPRNQGYYSVKSRYYTNSNTTETKGEFTFNNPEKYSIISDFSEYDDISNYARLYSNKKYDDTHKTIVTIRACLNWILHGHHENLDRLSPIDRKGLRPPTIIDTIVFVDLADYSKVDVVYDYTGKINILKKFVDKARYWSKERLKAQEEFNPDFLNNQGYFDSDLTENFTRLNINSFGKSKLISFEKYLLKLK